MGRCCVEDSTHFVPPFKIGDKIMKWIEDIEQCMSGNGEKFSDTIAFSAVNRVPFDLTLG